VKKLDEDKWFRKNSKLVDTILRVKGKLMSTILLEYNVVELLKILETEKDLQCQGICTPTPLRLGSPVTLGPPKQACVFSAVQYFNKKVVSWSGWIFPVIALFTV